MWYFRYIGYEIDKCVRLCFYFVCERIDLNGKKEKD